MRRSSTVVDLIDKADFGISDVKNQLPTLLLSILRALALSKCKIERGHCSAIIMLIIIIATLFYLIMRFLRRIVLRIAASL